MRIAMALVAALVSSSALAGTYSAYVRYYDGFAMTADINVGAMSPHSEEARELAERRAALERVFGADEDAHLKGIVGHFLGGRHEYRRCHALIRTDGAHPWASVEDMWGSERTSPLRDVPLPAPPARRDAVSVLDLTPSMERPEVVTINLYLADEVPYRIRKEVLPLMLVASQLDNGPLWRVKGDTPVLDFMGGAGYHFRIVWFLSWARSHRSELKELADGPVPDTAQAVQRYLWSHALLHALDGREISKEVLKTIEERAEEHTAALFAGLVRDSAWPAVAAALARWPWVKACSR